MSSRGDQVVITNRKARYDYHVLESYECGIVLLGAEVKSIRDGHANLQDGYARVDDGEVWLHGLHVSPYSYSHGVDLDPIRKRKLLLHNREIEEIEAATAVKGVTLVPLRIYFKDGRAKVELAVGTGQGALRQAPRDRRARREAGDGARPEGIHPLTRPHRLSAGARAPRGRDPRGRDRGRAHVVVVVVVLVLGVVRGDGVHLLHVEGAHLTDEVLERGLGQRARLREHDDVLAEDHQGRDRLDAERTGELLLRLGVDLGEHEVGVRRRGLLEHGRELPARAAPGRPEVDQDGVVSVTVSSKFSVVISTVAWHARRFRSVKRCRE